VSDSNLYPIPSEWAQRARMTKAGYEAARTAARETPEAFWSEQARRLDWMTPPTSIKDVSFNKADFRIRWFGDGMLNVAYNCLDRHLEARGEETAIRLGGRRANPVRRSDLPRTARRSMPHGQCAQGSGRGEG